MGLSKALLQVKLCAQWPKIVRETGEAGGTGRGQNETGSPLVHTAIVVASCFTFWSSLNSTAYLVQLVPTMNPLTKRTKIRRRMALVTKAVYNRASEQSFSGEVLVNDECCDA